MVLLYVPSCFAPLVQEYETVANAIGSLLVSPHQTPFTLFYTLVFMNRFVMNCKPFAELVAGRRGYANQTIKFLRMIFIMAVEMTDDDVPFPEKYDLLGYIKL